MRAFIGPLRKFVVGTGVTLADYPQFAFCLTVFEKTDLALDRALQCRFAMVQADSSRGGG